MAPDGRVAEADFGIIVALPAELHAVLRNLRRHGDVLQQTSEDEVPTYYVGRVLTTEKGRVYKVVVTMLRHMGNLDAAIATSDLLYRWHPRQLLVVGIAGGTDKRKQNFGDVLISESIFYYEESKLRKAGAELRPRMLPADPLLYARALHFKPTREFSHGAPPAVHFGPLASGENVIADKRAIKSLLHYQPKLIGVEMETAGAVAAAFSASEGTRFLAIKAISDFADAAKNDVHHVLAADNSADWTFAFLESGPVGAETAKGGARRLDESRAPKARTTRKLIPKDEPPNDEEITEREKLFDEIYNRLDNEDFRTFLFLIGAPIDDIVQSKKSASVRELILHFDSTGKLEKLKRLWHLKKFKFGAK